MDEDDRWMTGDRGDEGITMDENNHDAVLDEMGHCRVLVNGLICGGTDRAPQHVVYPVIGSGAEPTGRKYQRDLDDELDGIPDVHGRGGVYSPEVPNRVMVTSRFTDEAETHGTEPQDMVEAVSSDQNDEVGMFPDGTMVGDQPLPGMEMSAQMSFPIQVLSEESVGALVGIDVMKIRTETTRLQLEAAARRVTDYMRHSFSEATIAGVVQAITLEMKPWEHETSGPPGVVRRSDQPKEYVVTSGSEIAGPMTEAAANGLKSKWMRRGTACVVKRLIDPEDL